MTILIDLKDGRILHLAPGKGASSIEEFLKTPARRDPNMALQACDMNVLQKFIVGNAVEP